MALPWIFSFKWLKKILLVHFTSFKNIIFKKHYNFPMFDFQMFFKIKKYDTAKTEWLWFNFSLIEKNMKLLWGFLSVLEYEYIHLCTIQDMESFNQLLSTFQNSEKIKSGWEKLIFHLRSANLLLFLFLKNGSLLPGRYEYIKIAIRKYVAICTTSHHQSFKKR